MSADSAPTPIVVPITSGWNDFGYYFGATLHILAKGELAISIEIKLMIEGYDRTESAVTELLGTNQWGYLGQFPKVYCSIFDEIDSYRDLVSRVGFEAAIAILRGVGDAVVTIEEAADKERIALMESEAFALGVLRQEATYVAYRRGIKYLRPQPITEVADSAKSILIAASLPTADNPYQVDFNFEADELFRNRLAVLIGRNGTGKTQLLRAFIGGLLSYHEEDPLARPTLVEPRGTFNRMLVFSSVASDPYPRSIPIWKGLDYSYFSMTANPIGEIDAFTEAFTDCVRDDGKIRFVAGDGSMFAATGRVALLERALDRLGLSAFIHLPLKLIDGTYEFTTVQYSGRQYVPFKTVKHLGEKRRLLLTQAIDRRMKPVLFGVGPGERELSSGEMALLRFATQAIGSAERGCIFLFDEPETHLHPNYVSEFIGVLNEILVSTHSVAVIVTHSAYVVREVPKQRVRVFSLNQRNVFVDQPRLQTFGASIDSISQFVFEDTSISHQYQETLTEWLDTLGPQITIEEVLSRFGSQMNSETLSFIARLISVRSR